MPDVGPSRGTRPRLAVVHPYWTLWEHTAGPTFRADRLALARHVAASLEDAFEIVGVGDFASAEEARLLAPGYAAAGVDVVLAIQTMAAPPAYTLGLLDALPGLPVVIWALHETGLVEGSFDHGGITTQGATVGAPMLSNILGRLGRPFELVLGRLSDEATVMRVREALRLAATARRISRSRLGRVGVPLDGYLHVDVDDDELRRGTGIEVVRIAPDELVGRYLAVDAARLRALDAEVRATWVFEGDVDGEESLERSLRVALALEDMIADHRLDAGAFNCHVPQFRFGEPIGIAPCWALGRSTSAGVPWSCTGDILTAVAMLVTKRLGGAAVYHEIETIDYNTGEVVIANSGEHDLAWLAPGEPPRLRRNGWFCGKDPHCGVCAVLEPPAGPATLVAFTPHPDARGGFRLVAARGDLTKRRFPETGTVNGAFRFRDGTVEEAWARWASAGVNHHSSATPGDLSGDVAAVARHLGIEAVIV
jgi:L-arabinose isomerase